jgi:hypothetical protein
MAREHCIALRRVNCALWTEVAHTALDLHVRSMAPVKSMRDVPLHVVLHSTR